jgi:hypothetical protein
MVGLVEGIEFCFVIFIVITTSLARCYDGPSAFVRSCGFNRLDFEDTTRRIREIEGVVETSCQCPRSSMSRNKHPTPRSSPRKQKVRHPPLTLHPRIPHNLLFLGRDLYCRLKAENERLADDILLLRMRMIAEHSLGKIDSSTTPLPTPHPSPRPLPLRPHTPPSPIRRTQTSPTRQMGSSPRMNGSSPRHMNGSPRRGDRSSPLR